MFKSRVLLGGLLLLAPLVGCSTIPASATVEKTIFVLNREISTNHILKMRSQWSKGGWGYSCEVLFGPNPDDALPGVGRWVLEGNYWIFQVEHSWAYLYGHWPKTQTPRVTAASDGVEIIIQIENVPPGPDVHRVIRMDPASGTILVRSTSAPVGWPDDQLPWSVKLTQTKTYCEIDAASQISGPKALSVDPSVGDFVDWLATEIKVAGM